MAKNSDKEYRCPYCFQTSSRKYNINIHIQRKHHYYPQINNTNQFPTFNEPPNFIDFETSSSYNRDGSMEQPTSPASFIPPTFTFYPNSFFYDAKVKDDENERRDQGEDSIKTLLGIHTKNCYTITKVSKYTVQLY